MEKETISKIIFLIINAILSLIIANLGFLVFSENKAIGILTILIAFILLYFSFYIYQIRKNEKEIKELKEKSELNEKVLNSIRDIVILNKIKKIK